MSYELFVDCLTRICAGDGWHQFLHQQHKAPQCACLQDSRHRGQQESFHIRLLKSVSQLQRRHILATELQKLSDCCCSCHQDVLPPQLHALSLKHFSHRRALHTLSKCSACKCHHSSTTAADGGSSKAWLTCRAKRAA